MVAAREDRFRGFGGELAAGIRGAGLHDHRPALDRPRDVERAAHRQIFALVVEHVQLVGIEIESLRDVADEGVVRPGIPQAGDDVVELARAAVAFAVLHVIAHAEIERRVGIGGRDDIPAGAAAAEMIERSEPPRDVIGRVERGRAGGDEADDARSTIASADSNVNGSNDVTVWLCLSASSGMFSTAR